MEPALERGEVHAAPAAACGWRCARQRRRRDDRRRHGRRHGTRVPRARLQPLRPRPTPRARARRAAWASASRSRAASSSCTTATSAPRARDSASARRSPCGCRSSKPRDPGGAAAPARRRPHATRRRRVSDAGPAERAAPSAAPGDAPGPSATTRRLRSPSSSRTACLRAGERPLPRARRPHGARAAEGDARCSGCCTRRTARRTSANSARCWPARPYRRDERYVRPDGTVVWATNEIERRADGPAASSWRPASAALLVARARPRASAPRQTCAGATTS